MPDVFDTLAKAPSDVFDSFDVFDGLAPIPQIPESELRTQLGGGTPIPSSNLELAAQNEQRRVQLGGGNEGPAAPGPIEFLSEMAAAPGKLAYAAAADTMAATQNAYRDLQLKLGGDRINPDLIEPKAEYGGNLKAMLTGAPDEPAPVQKFIGEVAKTNPKLATAANLSKALPELASMMAVNPEGAAGRLLALGFSADMIAHANPMFKEYAEEINKPPDQQNPGRKSELEAGIIQTFGFAPLAAKHGFIDSSPAAVAGRMLGREVKESKLVSTFGPVENLSPLNATLEAKRRPSPQQPEGSIVGTDQLRQSQEMVKASVLAGYDVGKNNNEKITNILRTRNSLVLSGVPQTDARVLRLDQRVKDLIELNIRGIESGAITENVSLGNTETAKALAEGSTISPVREQGTTPEQPTSATSSVLSGEQTAPVSPEIVNRAARVTEPPTPTSEIPASQLTPAERATAEGQKKMASEAASVATVMALNKRVREKSPSDAWDNKQIQAATGNQSLLNSIRDDLLPIYNRLYSKNRAVEPPTPPPTPSLESPEGASGRTVTPEVTPAREFVGMGGAVPGEFANKPTTPTSIKNAQVDIERAQRGLPAAIEPARRSFGKVWDDAMARIDHDPLYPDTLLSELRSKPRSLTDAEDAVLLHRQVDLQNEYGKATRALAQEAEAMKNFPERQEFYENEKARVSALSDELFDLYEIGKKVGTETGRGLNARKMLAYEDFTLANMEMQRRAINEGKPLTEAQSKETTDLNKKIEQTQKAFDDYASKSESVGAEKAFNEVVSEVQRSAKKKPSPSLEAEKGNTTAELKSRFSKGDKNNITDLVQKLARQFVEGGIRERNALIDAVHDVLVGIDPAFTRRETMDAISGYGAFRQLTKDEISVKLRDLKGQMQQVAKLEDMQAGRPPLKTGVERRIPSPEESRLIKLVNEAKNEFQIPIEDPNTQLKSSLDTLKSRLKNRTTELQGMLERKEFAKKPKRIVQMDAEANRLHFEMSKAKAAWHEALMKDRLARRSVPRKIWDTGGEIMNTSRALLTSMDLSAVLRQGGFIALAHPIRAAKSFPAMMRAFASEAGQHAVDREIVSRKNYPLYNQSKLYLSEHGQKLSQMEEAYMSRWADKIPLVAGSQRAYVTFLNKLRADSFDAMANALARNKELTPAEANAISNFINVATGRGNLGMKENALVGLNTVFFAPRYVASRFQLLAGQPFYRGNARTRVTIAKEYARYALGVGLIYSLATIDGADIESDPRSSDFGKLKYGNTRLDPISGLAQTSVLLGRLGSGETKTARGNIVPIRGEKVPFGSSNSAEVMGRFVRSKLAPVPGAIVNTLTGKDVVGKPVTPESTAQNLLVPLSFDEIAKTMQEQGIDRGTAMAILSILGMGLQNYDAEAKR